MPSQVRLRIVGPSPEAYRLRLRIGERQDYRVPEDGRLTLDVPAYQAGCAVDLLGIVTLPNHLDPYTAKVVDLIARGKTARLSLSANGPGIRS
jgi:hypothetical protein